MSDKPVHVAASKDTIINHQPFQQSHPKDDRGVSLRIISATYGPHDGRRLLSGELSTSSKAKAPYERDVLPFLRAMLAVQSRSTDDFCTGNTFLISNINPSIEEAMIMNNSRCISDYRQNDSDEQYMEIDESEFALVSSKNAVNIFDGLKSMNAIFGDPCPGTTKRLLINYIFEDDQSISDTDNIESDLSGIVCRSSFAEHEKVVLRRNKRKMYGNGDGIDLKYVSPSIISQQTMWRLNNATSEVVIPLLLPYLLVKQRVVCQSVCQLWRNVIREWGVAQSIDVNDPSFPNFNRKFLKGVIQHSYSSLHTLVLNDYRDLREEDLLPAIPHFRKLRNLDLSRCLQVTNRTLLLIAEHLFMTLEVLYMKGLNKVTDAGMISLSKKCSKLRVLELSEVPITDESGICIGQHLRRLEALYMRDNFTLTNRSIDVITTNCTRLTQLTLWGCIKMKTLKFNAEDLVLLNLWGCHGLTDSVAESMGCLCNLKSLILSECHRLTDTFILSICETVPQIYHLNLRYLRRITDTSIRSIAARMTNIYTIDLTFCTRISAQSLADLVSIRPNLSELRLFSCHQLDEQGIFALLREASRVENYLSILDLRECFEITADLRRKFSLMGGFREKQSIPGFLYRSARWSEDMICKFEAQIKCNDGNLGLAENPRRCSDADLIYGRVP